MSEGGLAAVVRLSNGDMRKALNILQVFLSDLFNFVGCIMFVLSF